MVIDGGCVIVVNVVGEFFCVVVDKVYEGVKFINFDGMYYCNDIVYCVFCELEVFGKFIYV